jgi:hypothetical protein
MTTPAVHGSCLCGAVRFAVELPVLFCGHCHCSMCRRAHGAGYVTWIGAARERFSFLGGEERLTRYRSSEHGTRSFCRTCGSTLFCELTTRPGVIDIVLANLDATSDIVPQAHVYFDDRAEWVRVGDDLPRFGGNTGVEPL